MDLSVEKRFGNHFSVYVKANNLLNTPTTIFIKGVNQENTELPGQSNNNETLIKKEYYKQTYLVGLRYKL